jgi:hypothetical protein
MTAPIPARITIALDALQLHGPEVDIACGTHEGNPAGDVDAWEEARAVPSAEQVEKLAALCRMPVEYFYAPIEDYERDVRMFMCDRTKRKHGLTIVTSRVDERGVLHREYHQPSRTPP